MQRKFCLSLLTLFLLGCNRENERQTIIDAAIKEQVNVFVSRKFEEAEKKEMNKAIEKADSVLLLNADLWQLSMDVLRARPPKAIKPTPPNITIAIDSTPVKPLYPELIKK